MLLFVSGAKWGSLFSTTGRAGWLKKLSNLCFDFQLPWVLSDCTRPVKHTVRDVPLDLHVHCRGEGKLENADQPFTGQSVGRCRFAVICHLTVD